MQQNTKRHTFWNESLISPLSDFCTATFGIGGCSTAFGKIGAGLGNACGVGARLIGCEGWAETGGGGIATLLSTIGLKGASALIGVEDIKLWPKDGGASGCLVGPETLWEKINMF